MKKYIPALCVLGFSSLIYAGNGTVKNLFPPHNGGTCKGQATIIDENGGRFTAKTPLANKLSVQVGDAVSFEIKGKGRKAVNVTPVFGEPSLCYLSAEEFEQLIQAGPLSCEIFIESGVDLDDTTKHAIRNAARKLGEDNGGSNAQVIITKI